MLTILQINDILDVTIKDNSKTKGIYNMVTDFFRDNVILEKESIILTLIYLKRYKDSKCIIDNKNLKDLVETCLILSNKFICDFEISGSGPLENHVLDKINWNLYVDYREFEHIRNITYSNFKESFILNY